MKPSRKISLIYTLITIGLVLIACGVFFILSSRYTETLYYRYLSEKTQIVAMERFEKDELDSIRYQNVIQRRQNSIPTSREVFINTADRDSANIELHKFLSDRQLEALYKGEVVNFRVGEEVGTALIYYDNEGTFAVAVFSRNPYGKQISRSIGWALVLLIAVASVVLFLISRLYAARMIDRIDQDYQTEKLFVNNASHEINNPLTAIQGECEVALMRERSPEEYRNSLTKISKETDRIIKIIKQLLYFSHNKSESEDAPETEIGPFLSRFADDNTQVEIIDDFSVQINEELLQIAIGNIVKNARKYADGQPIVVKARQRRIEVIDFGIGIPAADLPHVFEPFYRASNAASFSGNGIGLALSKSILEKHSATLKVTSTEGEGSTFTIRFS